MLHRHALAVPQDSPGASAIEVRRQAADITEGITIDVADIVAVLRGEDDARWEAAIGEDDRKGAAVRYEMAGATEPGDANILAEMRREMAEVDAMFAERRRESAAAFA